MTSVYFIGVGGEQTTVDVADGTSVMAAAVLNNVRGIDGECGGSLDCATCHVYVDEAFLALLPAPSDGEEALLDGVAAERRPSSRLGCQIKMSAALSGLQVTMPARQS